MRIDITLRNGIRVQLTHKMTNVYEILRDLRDHEWLVGTDGTAVRVNEIVAMAPIL
jgi:hypothetical protein